MSGSSGQKNKLISQHYKLQDSKTKMKMKMTYVRDQLSTTHSQVTLRSFHHYEYPMPTRLSFEVAEDLLQLTAWRVWTSAFFMSLTICI